MTHPSIRQALPDDAQAIATLYWRSLDSAAHQRATLEKITRYPAVVAEVGQQLIGFAYSQEFAPDILELSNIFVHETYRSQHIGQRLLGELEITARHHYKSIILVNSDLYTNAVVDKRPATHFYTRQGYKLIFETDHTRGFFKHL